jgi:hypothetical protein
VQVRELVPNLGESGILAGMLFPVAQMADVGAQQLDLPVLLVLKLLQLNGVFLLCAVRRLDLDRGPCGLRDGR